MGKIGVVTKTLINGLTYNANTTVDITDKLYGIQWVQPPIFHVTATEVNNGTTLDIAVQLSFNGGANYTANAVAMTQLSASGNETKVFAIPPWADKARINLTFGQANYNWTVTAKVSGVAMGGGRASY